MTEIPAAVLVVDDEIQIRRFLRTGFELDGFTVHEAETGAEALRSATLKPSDLVILDLNLPDMDGADVLERLRAWSTVPLIVLSVRANEAEKVRLLELGADDYVVKPFGMAELLARAHSAMRRQLRAARGEPSVKFGPLAVDFAARAVYINDQRVMLTPKEYRLLQILAQHSGNVVTHQFMLREIWGSEHIDDSHYLRIFVRNLRRKIEADPTQPRILVTEFGVGYRLVMSDPPTSTPTTHGLRISEVSERSTSLTKHDFCHYTDPNVYRRAIAEAKRPGHRADGVVAAVGDAAGQVLASKSEEPE